MGKMLRCRDVGPDCDFVVHADSDDEIMTQLPEHARAVHGVDPVPTELATRARAAIHDVPLEQHEPPYTTTGKMTAPKFGAAGSGGLEYERIPEQHRKQ